MNKAIVIGGGIAGCSSAYALAKRGWHVTLIEQAATLATGASGNPLAVLYARLTGSSSHLNALSLASFTHSLGLLQELNLTVADYQPCGVLQLSFNARELERHLAFMSQVKSGGLVIAQYLNQTQASEIAGIKLKTGGLFMPQAGWVNPKAFCEALTQHNNIHIVHHHQVLTLKKAEATWQVFIENQALAEAQVLVIANAYQARQFSQTAHLPLAAVRGQLTMLPKNRVAALNSLKTIVCADSYLSPAVDGFHYVGTTFSMNDDDSSVRNSDHIKNLSALASITNLALNELEIMETIQHLKARVAWRSQTPDYLPLVGQLMDATQLQQKPPRYNASIASLPWLTGLYINAGHGSKGMITAPYCADLIAQQITQDLLVGNQDMFKQLNPNRFILRALGLKQLAKTALM